MRAPGRAAPGSTRIPSSLRSLSAADGLASSAWVAEPAGPARGSVLVLQEIFGLTGHIRGVADRLAEAGYRACAPNLFSRAGAPEPIPYADPQAGLDLVAKTTRAGLDADIDAALDHLGPCAAVIGFCWGGGEAWRAAARRSLPAAACFYPTRMDQHLAEAPAGAVQAHIAIGDTHTPEPVIARMRAAKPDLAVHRYEATHGFMCEARKGFAPGPAEAAWTRVLGLFGDALTAD